MQPEETKTGLGQALKSIADKVKSMLAIEKNQLHNLFVTELKNIYWGEKLLIDTLDKVAAKATTAELQLSLLEHLEETRTHAHRLEEIFKDLNIEPVGRTCDALVGLTTEMNKWIAETEDGTIVRDAAIISTCQKIEHYEIATYGTLKTLAETLGYYQVCGKLAENLQDEKNADIRLTYLAEGFINKEAVKE